MYFYCAISTPIPPFEDFSIVQFSSVTGLITPLFRAWLGGGPADLNAHIRYFGAL